VLSRVEVLDSAFHRIDDAAEFREQSVAHEFKDAPILSLDFRLEQFVVASS
jgi:hypothetical protein